MAGSEGTPGQKKRVSFLMPYIDFCFMLIIIFIGMLSIAYFEPLGESMETRHDKVIDGREGINESKPRGLQERNAGLGDRQPDDGMIRPLTGPADAGSSAAEGTSADVRVLGGRADPAELERLRKRLEREQAELERLRKLEKELSSNKADAERMKELEEMLRKKQEELERLKKMRGGGEGAGKPEGGGEKAPLEIEEGGGNHYYVDLREKSGGR